MQKAMSATIRGWKKSSAKIVSLVVVGLTVTMLIFDPHAPALTYKGKLRASTGLSLLHGLNQLASRAEEITLRESKCPLYRSVNKIFLTPFNSYQNCPR